MAEEIENNGHRFIGQLKQAKIRYLIQSLRHSVKNIKKQPSAELQI